eukprot:TRINITY_DN76_c0_g1_i1.p1 TRINITY_DN76_c0_g1~~TRINITY_DN76_c0_g1_i1.p1  ORF type:complete len:112 (+),score=31.44 TRINITY_DN76_c0_g1_i1:29-364(+)
MGHQIYFRTHAEDNEEEEKDEEEENLIRWTRDYRVHIQTSNWNQYLLRHGSDTLNCTALKLKIQQAEIDLEEAESDGDTSSARDICEALKVYYQFLMEIIGTDYCVTYSYS